MYYVCDDSIFTPCDFKSGVKVKITLGSFQGEDGSCPSSLKASGAIAWLHPYLDYKIRSTMQSNYQIHGLHFAGEYKNKRLYFYYILCTFDFSRLYLQPLRKVFSTMSSKSDNFLYTGYAKKGYIYI